MSRKLPDTTIPCEHCAGVGMRTEHGLSHECGACFGTGLSTAPWHQRRSATTITLWAAEKRDLPPGTIIHGQGTSTVRYRNGLPELGTILLVSWPNPDYRGQ